MRGCDVDGARARLATWRFCCRASAEFAAQSTPRLVAGTRGLRRARRSPRTTRNDNTRGQLGRHQLPCGTSRAAAASSSTISTGRSTSSTSRRRPSRPTSTSTARVDARPRSEIHVRAELRHRPDQLPVRSRLCARTASSTRFTWRTRPSPRPPAPKGRRRRRPRPDRLHHDARRSRRRRWMDRIEREVGADRVDGPAIRRTRPSKGTARELLRVAAARFRCTRSAR